MYIQIEWCEPNKLYDFSQPILCWTERNKMVTFNETNDKRHWDWLVNKYKIKYWMYQFRLHPDNLNRVNITNKEQELDYFD